MNVEMPLAELDDLARSARALQLHAAGPASPMSPPPGIDQQVLAYAREMFTLVPIGILVLLLGVYPMPVLDLMKVTLNNLVKVVAG